MKTNLLKNLATAVAAMLFAVVFAVAGADARTGKSAPDDSIQNQSQAVAPDVKSASSDAPTTAKDIEFTGAFDIAAAQSDFTSLNANRIADRKSGVAETATNAVSNVGQPAFNPPDEFAAMKSARNSIVGSFGDQRFVRRE